MTIESVENAHPLFAGKWNQNDVVLIELTQKSDWIFRTEPLEWRTLVTNFLPVYSSYKIRLSAAAQV